MTRGCPRGARTRLGAPCAPQTRGRPPTACLGVGAPRPCQARDTCRPCALVPAQKLLLAMGSRPQRPEAVASRKPRGAASSGRPRAMAHGLAGVCPVVQHAHAQEHRRECGAKARAARLYHHRGRRPLGLGDGAWSSQPWGKPQFEPNERDGGSEGVVEWWGCSPHAQEAQGSSGGCWPRRSG